MGAANPVRDGYKYCGSSEITFYIMFASQVSSQLARCNVVHAPSAFLRFGVVPVSCVTSFQKTFLFLGSLTFPRLSGVFRCLTAPLPAIFVTWKVALFHPCSPAISQAKKLRSRPNNASMGWCNLLRSDCGGCWALTWLVCREILCGRKSIIFAR